jgi:hypothetical protein
MKRRTLVVPLIAALVLAASRAGASPVPGGTFEAMNRLPGRMLQHPTPAEEREFVDLLARYGIDRPGLYTAETRATFVARFKTLKPYFFGSQGNGGYPQESIQDLVRSLGDPGDRQRMCSALREWLTLPDDSLRPAQSFYLLKNGPDGKRSTERELWGARCRAAEMLSDWGDSTALPLIRAQLARPIDRDQARWSLIESVRRLESPDSAVFLTSGPSGRVINHRSLAEISSAYAGETSLLEKGKARPLDRVQTERVWAALSGALFGRKSGPVPESYGVRLDFTNGIHAMLALTDEGGVVYTDNSRVERWSLTLDSANLHDVVAALGGAE